MRTQCAVMADLNKHDESMIEIGMNDDNSEIHRECFEKLVKEQSEIDLVVDMATESCPHKLLGEIQFIAAYNFDDRVMSDADKESYKIRCAEIVSEMGDQLNLYLADKIHKHPDY